MIIIKSGALFQVSDGQETRYTSQFIQEKLEIAERQDKYSGWKHKEEDQQNGMVPRSMLWGGRKAKAAPPEIILAQEHGDGFHFVTRMSKSCGLFRYDRAKDEEIRLFHKEGFNPVGLTVDETSIVTTADSENGTRHLALYGLDGRNETIITAGDSLDEHPFLRDGRIYYDSRGIGRTNDGSVGGFGPRGIFVVGSDGQGMTAIRESQTYEYLMPKVLPDGTVYALRIPWERNEQSWWGTCRDVLMFPVVLTMAIVGFLNAFTMLFAKKSLLAHGGPRTPEQDIRKRIIHSKLVDIEQASRDAGRRVVAPRSWKLVKLDGERDVEVAANVAGFEVDAAGIYINTGFSVNGADGKELYASSEIISDFAIVKRA